jgi:Predicted nucleotide-binding protein containing TIR-like domain
LRALGLKPLEWSKARNLTGKPNPYTWEIVDKALSEAGAIVALLTPDDEARLEPHLWSEHESALEKEYLSQPRQNVLFEAGVAYGRSPQRTILVRVGSHRPMSDLAGHHILQLDDSPQSRQAVADALRTAGCPVDVTGDDWFRSGKFSLTEPERTRNESDRMRVETDQMKEAAARILLLKTRLKGFTDFLTASDVVTEIHNFFIRHPKCLNAANVAFLEKYPADFHDKALLNHSGLPSLNELKRDVESLHI